MKFSNAIVCALMAGSAAAFAPSRSASMPSTGSLSAATIDAAVPASLEKELASIEEEIEKQKLMQSQENEDADAAPAPISTSTNDRIQPGRYNDKEESIAIPFLKRPSALDGSLAGDIGFDPLGLSETNDLYVMQEAELRHARLAMLAVVGWPMSELLAPDWMLRGQAHMAPSVLNGFNPLSFLTTVAIFGAFGFFEYKTSLRRVNDTPIGKKHAEDMADIWDYGVPGDYNFDPLGLYSMFGDDAAGRKGIRELEIAHGRAAMVGITSFAAWEKLTGHPIVENSMFFHPNAIVPALAIAYLSFGFFFEMENTDQYMFQIRTSSEGQMRMGRMKNGMDSIMKENESNIEEAKKLSIKLAEGAVDLKKKYDDFVEDYTKSKMEYANKD
mmetsp:Transcript_13783/g.40292  ORF Transcript_13783/g.40292 Transcript_13783/m.40292 type:complete len:386 (-) Transcript_13783:35-1192(-)